MKLRIPLAVAAVVVFSMRCVSDIHAAVWLEDFSSPAYEVGETVVGINGWKKTVASPNEVDASIATPSWHPSNLLRVKKSTSSVIRIYNDGFTAYENSVRLTVTMGFNFVSNDTNTNLSLAFMDPGSVSSPISFGMNFANTGGLYVANNSSASPFNTVILPKAQVKMDSLYTFVLDINLIDQRFDVKVTGVNSSDDAFLYEASNIVSGGFASNKLSQIYFYSNTRVENALYIGSISMEPIPEPSALALLLIVGTAGAGLRVRRTMKNR